MQRIHPLDGEKQGMRVSPGSGYQAPRTSHEPQAELRASHDYGMRVRYDANSSTIFIGFVAENVLQISIART